MSQKRPGRDDGPSLELPSFGLRRRRKRAAEDPGTRQPDSPVADPQPQASPADEPPPEPEPAAGPAPTAEAAPEQQPEPYPTARPLFTDEPPATTGREPDAHPEPEPRRRPAIGGVPAAVVTGAVVGALTVVLTWGALRLCELVQGTSSCGTPGFFLLLAIMILMVLLGAALLRVFGVGDPGSTSLLGVGLVAVVALLVLVDLLFHWWMIIVIPVVAMATFALAHWVTATFVGPEPGDDRHR